MWVAAWVAGQALSLRGRRPSRTFFAVQHVAFAAALLTGAVLVSAHGWRLGHPRWLSLKVGLIAFLVVPLEGFHAFVCHVWLPAARGLSGAAGARRRERGQGMEDMIRTLALVLLSAAIPLVVWLSLKKPF